MGDIRTSARVTVHTLTTSARSHSFIGRKASYWMVKLAFWGFHEALRPRLWLFFFVHIVPAGNRTSWPFPMPIRAIDPVCPKRFYGESDNSIKISQQSALSFWIERETRWSRFYFVTMIVMDIWACKLEKMPISRKFEFWPLVAGLTRVKKRTQVSGVLIESNQLVLVVTN